MPCLVDRVLDLVQDLQDFHPVVIQRHAAEPFVENGCNQDDYDAIRGLDTLELRSVHASERIEPQAYERRNLEGGDTRVSSLRIAM